MAMSCRRRARSARRSSVCASGSGRSQGRDHGPVVATRGFQHDQRGRHGLEPTDKGSNPCPIVRDRPAFARRPQGNIELRFRDIYTHKHLGQHPYS
jgi:hypothetical protein